MRSLICSTVVGVWPDGSANDPTRRWLPGRLLVPRVRVFAELLRESLTSARSRGEGEYPPPEQPLRLRHGHVQDAVSAVEYADGGTAPTCLPNRRLAFPGQTNESFATSLLQNVPWRV